MNENRIAATASRRPAARPSPSPPPSIPSFPLGRERRRGRGDPGRNEAILSGRHDKAPRAGDAFASGPILLRGLRKAIGGLVRSQRVSRHRAAGPPDSEPAPPPRPEPLAWTWLGVDRVPTGAIALDWMFGVDRAAVPPPAAGRGRAPADV